MKKYKRYMVFTSDEYDNGEPLTHVTLDTDSREQALSFNSKDHLTVVFDRVEGTIIKEAYLNDEKLN